MLEGEELRAFAPYLAEDLPGASLLPGEGHANPLLRGAAVRPAGGGARRGDPHPRGGHRGGARFGRQASASGRARGAIRARRVVNAAGAWADEVAALSGLALAGTPRGTARQRDRAARAVARAAGPAHRSAADAQAVVEQHLHHRRRLAIAARRRHRPATRPIWDSAAGNAAVAIRVIPRLADVRIMRTWSGVMAFTDDLAPVVGESPRATRLLHVRGHDRLHARAADGQAAGRADDRFRRSPGASSRTSPPIGRRPVRRSEPERRTRWIETTSPGAAIGLRARPRFSESGELDLDLPARPARVLHRPGSARRAHQRHHRRVVLAVRRRTSSRSRRPRSTQVAGRMTVVIGCTALHGQAGGRARPTMR